jgi:hypothetical protein
LKKGSPALAAARNSVKARKKIALSIQPQKRDSYKMSSPESEIDDAGRQRVGCGIDSEFEPRQGVSGNSPGCSTLGNAARKKSPKAPEGATLL